MGVRGLTTYIAANAYQFLKPFELHDTDLVIDGDNLCIQLYVHSMERMSAFGGNYDHYFRTVVEFFAVLRTCNIRPWVLLDGGYERCKLKTVRCRMLGRIEFVKRAKPRSRKMMIPLLLREVFVDAMRAEKVSFMRCLFEADNEAAILARKLDCPVLSYDSDFYIHNVKYIPYVTLTHKIYRKVIENDGKYEIQWVRRLHGRNASKRVLVKVGEGPIDKANVRMSYSYLDCSLYTIENLIGVDQRLKPEMLPLFAALLGNDYISRRILSTFYASMKVGKVSRKVAVHQRRIVAILKWLKHHTLKSATTTILNQVQKKHRDALLRQLEGAMYGYNCEECSSYEYFGLAEESKTKLQNGAEKFQEYLAGTDDEVSDANELIESNDEATDEKESGNEASSEEELSEEDEQEEDEEENDDTPTVDRGFNWEPWLLKIYQAALTPRFVLDLYHSNLYINYPQVEDLDQPESNELCYDLLKYIFALLKVSKRATNFRYLTRCERVAQFRWIKFEDIECPEGVSFNPPETKNLSLLKVAFRDFPNCNGIFLGVALLPNNMQLYFLSLVYWATKVSAVTPLHVHALLVCLIQLQVLDKRLPNTSRDITLFQTNQKYFLETQRQSFQRIDPVCQERPSKTQFKKLSGSITKPEAILTYEKMLPHFSYTERQLWKHSKLDHPTLHVFTQLQAVVLNLFTLNALVGQPLEPIQMHKHYNGLFVHQLFQSLRPRKDPLEYIRGTLFRYSGASLAIHRMLYSWLVRFVPQLEKRPRTEKLLSNTQLRKMKRAMAMQVISNDCLNEEKFSDVNNTDDQVEYNDLNNQFGQLLLSSK